MDRIDRTSGHIAVRLRPGITLLPGSRVGRKIPGICRRAGKEEGSPMNRRAMAIVAGAIVVGVALLAYLRVAVDDNRSTEASVNAKTGWGEPDLTGVWKAAPLGAASGRDTFNLAKLEGLYTPEAHERMKALSANDDPTMRCTPPL